MSVRATSALYALLPRCASIEDGPKAIAELRETLGADAIFAFVRDAELGVLLPAPRFPPTVPTAEGWHALFDLPSSEPGAWFETALPYPAADEEIPAFVINPAQGTIVVLGRRVRPSAIDEISVLAPLWLQALAFQQRVVVADANAALASSMVVDADRTQSQLDQALRNVQNALREAADRGERVELLRATAERLLSAEEAELCLPAIALGLSEQFGVNVRLEHLRVPGSGAGIQPDGVSVIALNSRANANIDLGWLRVETEKSRRLDGEDYVLIRTVADQYAIACSGEALRGQLAERAEDLSSAVHLREEFLSVAAHELRNPIHIISGFAGVLQKALHKPSPDGDALIFESLGHIVRSAQKMTSIVDGFLDILRIERGRLSLDYSMADLTELIGLAVAEVESGPFLRAHRIVVDGPGRVNFVCDPARLVEVIANLLSNAAKYSPPNSQISVSAEEIGETLQVCVTDEGIGVSPEEQLTMFDAFVRGASAPRHAPGTGVGLFVARNIVQAHGGTIRVSSREHHGTTMTFTVPRMPVEFATVKDTELE